MSIRLTPRAEADIDEIWDYTARQWGIEQADNYVLSLWRAMELVAADPRRGRSADEIKAGYRKHASGSHLIYFRQVGSDIEVVRVLHGAMDHERHL
jgi:toxin ParE1/3/4